MVLVFLLKVFVCSPFQGNCGDSRSITSVAGVAQELSYDHKPSNEGNFVIVMMYF